MIRRLARTAALTATAIDLVAAGLDWNQGDLHIRLRVAALVTALALVPCALAFLAVIGGQLRRPMASRSIQVRQPPPPMPRMKTTASTTKATCLCRRWKPR